MSGIDAAFGYAPGKIILLGEHAVVYGQPALAATLNRGVRIAVTKKNDDDARRGPVFRGAGVGLETVARPDPDGEGPEALRRMLHRLTEILGDRVSGLQFVAESTIPAGSGLGSSAALSVSLVRGVHRFFDDQVTERQVMDLALELEKVFHGNPSGVDHSTIAHGGIVYFERHESGNVVEPVVLRRRLRFAIGLAGQHAGTASAVTALRERQKRHPARYESLFTGIGDLVRDARAALQEGHLGAVGELMDLNQGYLNALGVSTPGIESLVSLARDRGALGAKLSGAGGGGAVIALVDEDPQPVVQAFMKAGTNAFAAEIDVEEHASSTTPLRGS